MVEKNTNTSKMSPAKFNITFFKQPNDCFLKRVVLVCSGLLLKLLGISFSVMK